MMKMPKINWSKLEQEQLRRIDRVVHPRDTLFSRKFCVDDVTAWKLAARAQGLSLQQWMETHLRLAVMMGLKLAMPPINPSPREKTLSQRFTTEDVETWARQATMSVSTTDWVEYVLRSAARAGA